MYKVNDTVLARIARCACVGGGHSEIHGLIIGFIPDQFNGWYQVSTSNGVHYVRPEDILSISK